MAAYQSDYIDFYMSVMEEVNELTRIKVHERIKYYMEMKWHSFKMFIKYDVIGRINSLYIRFKRKFFPATSDHFKFTFEPKNNYDSGNACIDAPMKFHSSYEPQDEQISLSQYAYGKMIDKKFKKRFIDAENYISNESIYDLKREVVNYVYKQKLNSSVFLRIIVFLHFN